MKGLLLKDFLVITKQLKIFLFVIPVMAFVGGISISAIAVLMGAVLPMTAIAYDERSKWNELAVMMPCSPRDLVLNKYLFGYICVFGAAILMLLGQLFIPVTGRELTAENMNILVIAVFGGLVFIAVNTPVLFKFGSEKGRFVFIIAMALIGASGSLLGDADPNVMLKFFNTPPVVLIGIALVLNYISIRISIAIKPFQH